MHNLILLKFRLVRTLNYIHTYIHTRARHIDTHTNDASCTRDIKSEIAIAKAAFHKKTALFTSKFKSDLRNQLAECYIWSIALCGAGEGWTRSV